MKKQWNTYRDKNKAHMCTFLWKKLKIRYGIHVTSATQTWWYTRPVLRGVGWGGKLLNNLCFSQTQSKSPVVDFSMVIIVYHFVHDKIKYVFVPHGRRHWAGRKGDTQGNYSKPSIIYISRVNGSNSFESETHIHTLTRASAWKIAIFPLVFY